MPEISIDVVALGTSSKIWGDRFFLNLNLKSQGWIMNTLLLVRPD